MATSAAAENESPPTRLTRWRFRGWMRWLAVPIGTGLPVLIQQLVLPQPAIAPFVFFFVGVALAALLGGMGPGLLTAATSAAAGNWFFIAPFGQLTLTHNAVAATGLFLISGSCVALLSGWLQRAVDRAEWALAAVREGERRKDRFLAMLSHELRNPLAAIRASIWVIERAEPDAERAVRATGALDRQVTHMTRLVDDLLDAARITHGKLHLQPAVIDLREVIENAAEDHRPQLSARQLRLLVELPERPVMIRGDEVRLGQAVGNLIGNSGKFGRPGGTTTVTLSTDDATGVARIRVLDDGAGIAQEARDRLFTPFFQADDSLDRSPGGLGLGLAIAKALTEAHGGSIAAHSDGPGKGAEFTLTLPLERSLRVTESPGPVPRAGMRILVVEDNADTAFSLRDALELEGHVVQIAADAEQAFALMGELPFDVVLCDIGLPGTDGYAVAARIRATPGLAHLRLVALTGYAGAEDVDRATAAGFDHHLAKPPRLADLERVIAGPELPGQC